MEESANTAQNEAPEENSTPATAPSGSLRDRIAARRRALQGKRELLMPIPGYGNELWVRFKPVPWEKIEQIAGDTNKSKSRRKLLLAQADTLVAATEEILILPDGDGGVEDLKRIQDIEPSFAEEQAPIRFEQRLADYLQIDDVHITGARDVILAVIPEGLALTALHNDMVEWQESQDTEVDKELQGE